MVLMTVLVLNVLEYFALINPAINFSSYSFLSFKLRIFKSLLQFANKPRRGDCIKEDERIDFRFGICDI